MSDQDHYAAGTGDNTKAQTYDNPGDSTWNYHFGDQKTADYSIGLHILATTKRPNVRYTTKLTWTLTVAP
ncbi:WxL domain-containing protein [Latilactobacillus fragifolii]|uniref:WxL domain-containing protein n=1 Tax=Latilactobacillus fragifolii TaxID=2814244 RepID=UPI001ABB3495